MTGSRPSAPRPGYHFTPPSGHLNDPLGVTWHDHPDGPRYELFFQYNPDAPEWAVACHWGQTWGPDLVRWHPPVTALTPGAGEAGCWSGSVAVGDDGVPVIAYTRVRAGALDVGAVVLARGDRSWRAWAAEDEPVVAGPPEGVAAAQFRDPFVLRDGDRWRMVLGGGTGDGTGTAWTYHSPDLRSWRYEGVLAQRPGSETEPVWTGTAWECVQLAEVDDAWVLVVSVWDGDPRYLACAVGDLDGHRFTARTWQRLSATDVPYAATAFRDAAGRPCLMSWLREPGPVTTRWAGALSVPWVLAVVDDRVRLSPHPDVETLRTGIAAAIDGSGRTPPLPPFLDVEIGWGDGRLQVHGADGLVLAVDVRADGAVLHVPGGDPVRLGILPGGQPAVRLLLDAGLLEVATSAGQHAALRVPVDGPVRLVVPEDGEGRLRLVAHGMPAGEP